MKQLMKYEMRKTLTVKLMVLGIAGAAEIVFLLGLILDKENMMGLGAWFLLFLTFAGIMGIGLFSWINLHRDMNTKQAYMLFMTPNSCYKILGAKVLENGLSILLAGAFFFALGILDITLLFNHYGRIAELWDTITRVIASVNENIKLDAAGLASFAFSMLSGWIAMVTSAYLADVVSTALLAGKKHNGIVSFIFFVLIDILLTYLQRKLTDGFDAINTQLIVQGVIALVMSCGMYISAAEIMERKLSV